MVLWRILDFTENCERTILITTLMQYHAATKRKNLICGIDDSIGDAIANYMPRHLIGGTICHHRFRYNGEAA